MTEQVRMVVRLLNLAPALAAEANNALADHDWSGGGGACDAVTDAMAVVLAEHGFNFREGGWDGDDHAWLIVELPVTDYIVDIPADVYEEGGGYSWRPIPDVEIGADDVCIVPI